MKLGTLMVFGGAVLIATAATVVACSDDPEPQPGVDSGPDVNAVETGPGPDSGPGDTGADVETGPKPDPFCRIIGGKDEQMSINSKFCNDCIRENCCDLSIKCFEGPDAGSVYLPDAAFTPCLNRFFCFLDNCTGGVADAGGCEEECNAQYPAEVNKLSHDTQICILGSKPGTPTAGNCSTDTTDGGLRCAP